MPRSIAARESSRRARRRTSSSSACRPRRFGRRLRRRRCRRGRRGAVGGRRRHDRHVGDLRLERSRSGGMGVRTSGDATPNPSEARRRGRGGHDEHRGRHRGRHPVCLPLRASADPSLQSRSRWRGARSARGVAPRACPARPGGRARGAMSSGSLPRCSSGPCSSRRRRRSSSPSSSSSREARSWGPGRQGLLADVRLPDCGSGDPFRLRSPDRVSVEIVDSGGTSSAARARPSAGPALHDVRLGRAERRRRGGRGGPYRPRVHLDRERRTIVMPNPIRVDTPRRASRASPRARPSSRRTATVASTARRSGTASASAPPSSSTWTGCVRCAGSGRGQPARWTGSASQAASRCLRAATRSASSHATSRGTSGRGPARGRSRIRFLALGRDRVVTAPGSSFAILAISQARILRWTLAGRSGIAPPGTLRLRAPDEPGRYVLRVDANGHVERAIVVVREAPA